MTVSPDADDPTQDAGPTGAPPHSEPLTQRWWDRERLAHFLGVRPHELSYMLGRGKIPRPSYHLGYAAPRWNRVEIEARFRRRMLKGNQPK